MGYNNLEYNLATGRRGSRMDGLEEQLMRLCGCEAALAVNNNAAAVLLVLSALCGGGEVLVSRGELVEIGGAFRVPEIIAQGGAVLREVGTTNKTRPDDYAKAMGRETAAILKVHTSNYRIVGYTQDVGLAELAAIGGGKVPLIYDLGGGALVPMGGEPTVQEALAQGADVLCFSGDKLLGGPQAGIIIGKKEYIDILRKHPLYRALRMDKLTLAALQATLQLYLDGHQDHVPAVAMLTCDQEHLKTKAEKLLAALSSAGRCRFKVAATDGQAGGGSLPGEVLPSWAVAAEPLDMTMQELEAALRGRKIPIIGRIHKGELLLDVRTMDERDFTQVAAAFAQ